MMNMVSREPFNYVGKRKLESVLRTNFVEDFPTSTHVIVLATLHWIMIKSGTVVSVPIANSNDGPFPSTGAN